MPSDSPSDCSPVPPSAPLTSSPASYCPFLPFSLFLPHQQCSIWVSTLIAGRQRSRTFFVARGEVPADPSSPPSSGQSPPRCPSVLTQRQPRPGRKRVQERELQVLGSPRRQEVCGQAHRH
eukprot:268825-Hanusia_phi.AAC.1